MRHIILSDAWWIEKNHYITNDEAHVIPFDPLVFDRYRESKATEYNCDMNCTISPPAAIRTPQLPQNNFCVGTNNEQRIFIRSGIDISTDCFLFGHISIYSRDIGVLCIKNIAPEIIYCSAFQMVRKGVVSLEVVVRMPAGTSIQLTASMRHKQYVKKYSWTGSVLRETISTIA